MDAERPPLPPFTKAEDAARKVRMAEDAWNGRDPIRVAKAYTTDSHWRNRSEFIIGRADIEAFLQRKWSRELEYRLVKELWTTASPSALHTNGTTTADIGTARTATRTGNSTNAA
jgi:nuclear transport factor 2 (NTF2) superfamily protein